MTHRRLRPTAENLCLKAVTKLVSHHVHAPPRKLGGHQVCRAQRQAVSYCVRRLGRSPRVRFVGFGNWLIRNVDNRWRLLGGLTGRPGTIFSVN